MKFSDRHGYTSARNVLQLEEIDVPLRNRLRTLLKAFYWDSARYRHSDYGESGYFLGDSGNEKIRTFCRRTWHNHYKEPIDTLSDDWSKTQARFRAELFKNRWYEVYNFLEWVVTQFPDEDRNAKFILECNKILEEEMSAYRFVNQQITPITDKNEIEALDEAAKNASDAVAAHLRRSLELLSDREKPDYRNAIKEAISAVEALAIKVTGAKSTLGQLLKQFDDHIPLHPALKAAFEKLYGYTSDKEGIRHALMEQQTIDFGDAKFMCSSSDLI